MNNFTAVPVALALGAALLPSAAPSQDSAPAFDTRPEDSDTPPSGTERPDLPRLDPGLDPVTICGSRNEMQHVEKYDGSLVVSKGYVNSHEPSTVQLRWLSREEMKKRLPGHDLGNVSSKRWCTGTLVGPTIVLTAGHCLDVQKGNHGSRTPFRFRPDGSREFVVPRDLAKLQSVVFNYQQNGTTGLERPGMSFPVLELKEYWRGPDGSMLDYAILEVGPDSRGKLPTDHGFVPAILAVTPAPDGATLGIIQHPNGEPKKVEAGRLQRRVGAYIDYSDIDTIFGSSGSGIRNSEGALIGVHIEGGCTASGGANRGVSIEAIKNVSDEL